MTGGPAPARRPARRPREFGPAGDPDPAPEPAELPAPRPTAGELLALYVTPDLIGTGVGRALLTAGTARARANGYRALHLWVVRGNTHARRFYERAGFVPDGAQQAYEVGGRNVPEVRYRRPLTPGPDGPPAAPSPRSAS
ncbi:GNAT family N-acetyltransferase [Streptomyces angustmyceticus]|uniref:N-acetyltransferase domain-containing protein n=1 Tax=Streptomyces angustmyceticus TaxID=285578 RepID=A0A5J4LFI0_9ACTN|nr:GNAT family N-acetyltransferase [Streptomyces angustmyceticus]UAL66294.1 GNAT family N-acetyltransferase [Streptomyces angustmyceticus]GES28935.1 hypothetical protein San01_14220 [Streptomyces angustmyceticus]